MQKKLVLFIVTLFLLSSCQKDIVFPDGAGPGTGNNPSPTPASFTLAGTSWLLTASTTSIDYGGMIFDSDLFALIPVCSRDDIHTFNANGTATDDQATNKCDPNAPQSVTNGTWKLSSDKKTLSLFSNVPSASGVTNIEAEVLQLNETTLKVRYITYVNGPKATTTTTYTRTK